MKSPYRRAHASLATRIVACGMCALLALTSLQVRLFAEQRGAASQGHSRPDKPPKPGKAPKVPGLRFVTPTHGHTETNQDLQVALEVGKHEDLQSLVLKLNGRDVTKDMTAAKCRVQICTVTGTLTVDDGLRTGSNRLTASVSNRDHTAGTIDRTMFSYFGLEGATSDVTLDYYVPSSVGFDLRGADPTDLLSLTLTSGNGNVVANVASLPALTDGATPPKTVATSIPYPDQVLGGAQCEGFQGWVLERTKPFVVLANQCGEDLATVENNLSLELNRDFDNTDLVVLASNGSVVGPGLDTSTFGGTNYAALPAGSPLYPKFYMMIGVKGAPAGTAHESYSVWGTADTVQNYSPALTGTLMIDGNSHYNFVPDGDAEFQVVSGASPQIMAGPYTFTPPPTADPELQNNVFWLVVLDRQTLQPINLPIVNEAGEVSSTACQAVAGAQSCGSLFAADYGIYPDGGGVDLAETLSGISPRNLIFLTTQGCPFNTEFPFSSASASLGTALQNIGGMRYSVNALTTATPSTCAYSLVSVNDGNHQFMTSKAALSASQFAAQGQIGAIHGFLARDNAGLYDVAGKNQMTAGDAPAPTVDYTFERIVSATRTGWSLAYDADLWAAYNDISFQLLRDPSILETGSHIYDVRYFYTGVTKANAIASLIDLRLAPTATNPVVQTFSATTTTPDRFALARATIMAELQQVKSATGYLTGADGVGGIRGILADSKDNLLYNPFNIAGEIIDDEAKAAAQIVSANGSDFLNLAAGIVSLAAAAAGPIDPGVAVFMGMMSGVLWTGSAAMTPLGVTTTTIPGPESPYDALLQTISDNASHYGNRLLSGFDGAVDNILTDGGKLAQVAALTSNSDSAWNLTDLANLDKFEASIMNGARLSLWMDVLPNLYGVRVGIAMKSTDPATYGSWVYTGEFKSCLSVYSPGNSAVPTDSMTSNHHVGDGLTSTWDVNILAEGPTVVYPTNPLDVQDHAMSQTLSEKLTTTTGLNIAPMMLINNGPFTYSPIPYFVPTAPCDAYDPHPPTAPVPEGVNPPKHDGGPSGPRAPRDPRDHNGPRDPKGPRDRGGWHAPPRDPQPPSPRGGDSPRW